MPPTTDPNNNDNLDDDIVDDWMHLAAMVEDEHLVNQAPYAIRVKQEDDAESARMREAQRAIVTRELRFRAKMRGVR